MSIDQLSGRIVFFDGFCNLCNTAVDFLVRKDQKKILRYAPLSGNTVKKFGLKFPTVIPDSFIYYRDGVFYFRSTAAIRVMSDLGFWWKWINIFYLIPAFLRDAIYNWIAKNRYRWFGVKSSCRIPNEGEMKMFLD